MTPCKSRSSFSLSLISARTCKVGFREGAQSEEAGLIVPTQSQQVARAKMGWRLTWEVGSSWRRQGQGIKEGRTKNNVIVWVLWLA